MEVAGLDLSSGIISPFGILVLIALGLLVTVTGGITYLTVADWRDRRRRERDSRQEKVGRKK